MWNFGLRCGTWRVDCQWQVFTPLNLEGRVGTEGKTVVGRLVTRWDTRQHSGARSGRVKPGATINYLMWPELPHAHGGAVRDDGTRADEGGQAAG